MSESQVSNRVPKSEDLKALQYKFISVYVLGCAQGAAEEKGVRPVRQPIGRFLTIPENSDTFRDKKKTGRVCSKRIEGTAGRAKKSATSIY